MVIAASEEAGEIGAATPVAWCSETAREAGLRAGMPVREVWASCPQAAVLAPDPVYYARLSDSMFDALEGAVPVVEEGGLGRAYADLSGMEGLYPDVRELLRLLARTAAEATGGLRAVACAGPNKFVAGVAAEEAMAGAGEAVVTAERARKFLEPLSVRYLPVSGGMHERLAGFGLRRMGQIARLTAAQMQDQFGPEGLKAWSLSRGVDREPVTGRRPFRPIAETLSFSTPITEWAGFWAALRELLVRVWKRPERKEAPVRQLRILARVDAQAWEKTVTLHEPIGDRERLEKVLQGQLRQVSLPGALAELTLQLTVLGGTAIRQASFFAEPSGRLSRLKQALAAVKARRGTTGLYRIAEVEPWSRIPERRYALIHFDP